MAPQNSKGQWKEILSLLLSLIVEKKLILSESKPVAGLVIPKEMWLSQDGNEGFNWMIDFPTQLKSIIVVGNVKFTEERKDFESD